MALEARARRFAQVCASAVTQIAVLALSKAALPAPPRCACKALQNAKEGLLYSAAATTTGRQQQM
jgi:hypothetical protein